MINKHSNIIFQKQCANTGSFSIFFFLLSQFTLKQQLFIEVFFICLLLSESTMKDDDLIGLLEIIILCFFEHSVQSRKSQMNKKERKKEIEIDQLMLCYVLIVLELSSPVFHQHILLNIISLIRFFGGIQFGLSISHIEITDGSRLNTENLK